MTDIQMATEDLIQQVFEYLDEAPIKMENVICHDDLYDICEQQIIDDLAAAAEENHREEATYEQFDTED